MAQQRLGPADWIAEALDVIASSGVGAVAVEPIARRLGVTKGSFYSHFDSRDALVRAALDEWLEQGSGYATRALRGVTSPGDRLRILLYRSYVEREAAMTFLALTNSDEPKVRRAVSANRSDRIELYTGLLVDLGLPEELACERATVIHAAYTGYWNLVITNPDRALDDDGAEKRAIDLVQIMSTGEGP